MLKDAQQSSQGLPDVPASDIQPQLSSSTVASASQSALFWGSDMLQVKFMKGFEGTQCRCLGSLGQVFFVAVYAFAGLNLPAPATALEDTPNTIH